MSRVPNNWVQATPSCVCMFLLSQGLGAPDPERSVNTEQPPAYGYLE